jgi:hypothetical protein
MVCNHLPKELTFRKSFLFPIESPEGRRDIFIGGIALICLLPIGWVLNLGARLDVVHRIYCGEPPYFRGMKPWSRTFKRGCISASTIFSYLFPANLFFSLSLILFLQKFSLGYIFVAVLTGFSLFLIGIFTLPGCMTVYACEEDPRILLAPLKAFRRAIKHRSFYLKAWLISLSAIALSFFGLIFCLVGFFFTSVWAWEVVGYAFTIAMYNEPDDIDKLSSK